MSGHTGGSRAVSSQSSDVDSGRSSGSVFGNIYIYGDGRHSRCLGQGARAVGDGQGRSLSHSVGLSIKGESGGSWAVGSHSSDDLSDSGVLCRGADRGRGSSGRRNVGVVEVGATRDPRDGGKATSGRDTGNGSVVAICWRCSSKHSTEAESGEEDGGRHYNEC